MRADPALTWYALTVAPQRELTVRGDLEAEGQRIIVPMEPVWRRASRHARRLERTERPLIPGYVFAGARGRIPFEIYRKAKAYRDVVKFAGIPAPVDHRQLQAIIDLVAQMEAPPMPGQTVWQIGQGVKVLGRRGTITAILKHKVRVLQDFLGAFREIVVQTSKLEAVAQETLAVNANHM
jgi:transcription antitermination factor NusG